MEQEHDKKFFDTFLLILGGLVLFAVAMYFVANAIAEPTEVANEADNPLATRMLEQRLAPVAEVNVAGQSTPAAKTQVAMTGNGGSSNAAATESGKKVYNSTCVACHGTGILGAPKFGDATSWAPHVAKGYATLLDHAMKGFKQMPAKGGNPGLTEADMANAIKYMVDHSGGFPKGKGPAK